MQRNELEQALWEQRLSMMRLAVSILRHPQDAEDAVSDAIVRVYFSSSTLKKKNAFKPWVMRITANVCYDLLRKRKREREHLQQVLALEELFEMPQEETLFQVMMRLPKGIAQVLNLYYYENFSTSEIAQILRIPGGTVRMRLTRGRRMLREMMEEEME